MFDNQAVLVAFIAAKDLTVARSFYAGTLGLEVESEDSFALVCKANGTTLRIQKVDALTPQVFTVLGWTVPSVAAAVDALAQRGVAFERYEGMPQDERGIWTAPGGTRVAWFKDPHGNTLSLSGG
ncbi:VOC family protein [Pendulispora rubella]|uniref:VOC family protein n=1 Tax=Pendulispora rubella TaxID=2741070 RepID=A0ABZ2L3I3_9BACT